MNACVEECKTVIAHDEQIKNLVGWQKSQNGAIHDVHEKVDKIIFLMLGQMAALLIAIAAVLMKG